MGTRIVVISPELLTHMVTEGSVTARLGYTDTGDPTLHPWPDDVHLHMVWQRMDVDQPHGSILLELASDAWGGEEIEIDVIFQAQRGGR